jgi:hypothetical protein
MAKVKSVVVGPDLTDSIEVEERDLAGVSSGRQSRRDARKDRQRREKHGSRYHDKRQRSRSSSRSRTPARSHSRGEHEDERLRNLKEMVTQLTRQGLQGIEPRPAIIRVLVNSDCIPEFIPGQTNQSPAKWVDKTTDGTDGTRTQQYNL